MGNCTCASHKEAKPYYRSAQTLELKRKNVNYSSSQVDIGFSRKLTKEQTEQCQKAYKKYDKFNFGFISIEQDFEGVLEELG